MLTLPCISICVPYLARYLPIVAIAGMLIEGSIVRADSSGPAWHRFQHALGQPAWIGANAGHEHATSAYRPIPDPGLSSDQSPGSELKRDLGASLFHEGRLSSGNSIACVTCHAGALSGADRRRVSLGVGGARGTMNALSVFNAAFNFRQFWDGRAVTLEDQALIPIQDPAEMAHTLEGALEMLRMDSSYPDRFAAIYPDGITVNNVADAIAHFQRLTFVRRDTPFQRYLRGEIGALDTQALRGRHRFEELGCVRCHNGINLGGNSYQRLGEAIPYYGEHRKAGPEDMGVMSRTGQERDRHVFKVPGLHGVATTAPYFHDGSISTLHDAVALMAKHQLGTVLSERDVEDIVVFLRSLGDHFSRTGDQGVAGRDTGSD